MFCFFLKTAVTEFHPLLFYMWHEAVKTRKAIKRPQLLSCRINFMRQRRRTRGWGFSSSQWGDLAAGWEFGLCGCAVSWTPKRTREPCLTGSLPEMCVPHQHPYLPQQCGRLIQGLAQHGRHPDSFSSFSARGIGPLPFVEQTKVRRTAQTSRVLPNTGSRVGTCV